MGSTGAKKNSSIALNANNTSVTTIENKIPTIGDLVHIKSWFIDKINKPNYAMSPYEGEQYRIIQETEKAYKISIDTETLDGEHDVSYTSWIPKSATQTNAQYLESRKQEEARYNKGVREYDRLIKFAKDNNIKGVRVGLKKKTILDKLEKAGLKFS
jgi:hypothetical protein